MTTVPTNVGLPCVNVPYGVVDEAWVGADGPLQLMLSVRLIFESGKFLFEPRG